MSYRLLQRHVLQEHNGEVAVLTHNITPEAWEDPGFREWSDLRADRMMLEEFGYVDRHRLKVLFGTRDRGNYYAKDVFETIPLEGHPELDEFYVLNGPHAGKTFKFRQESEVRVAHYHNVAVYKVYRHFLRWLHLGVLRSEIGFGSGLERT